MSSSGPNNSGDVPTLLVKDSEGRDLLCFLEQLIPLDGQDYALLTPVDTPVCLFRLKDGDEPELIDSITSNEPILSVADVVLQEHDLTLVRSAVTLTVNGELDEPDPEDLDEDVLRDICVSNELYCHISIDDKINKSYYYDEDDEFVYR